MENNDNVVRSLKETDGVEWMSENNEPTRWASMSRKMESLRVSQTTGRGMGSGPSVVGVRKARKSTLSSAFELTGVERNAILCSTKPQRIRRRSTRSLFAVRGVLSLLLMAVVCLCLAWTLWLALLSVAPNETVNQVMATESFDHGSFWMLIEPPPALLGLAVFGLSAVALGFLSILVVMIMPCKRTRRNVSVSSSTMVAGKFGSMRRDVEHRLADTARSSSNPVSAFVARTVSLLIDKESSTRRMANVWVKIGDLFIETVLLFQVLEAGSPIPLVAAFTTIVVANALSCAIMMLLPYQQTGFVEVLVDTGFDFLVAVGYPMLVLLYCLSTFDFDRGQLALNLEVFPPGAFEQAANVIADPVQTVIIYKSLKMLRINSVLDFFTRVGVNLALCFHLHRVAVLVKDPQMGQPSVYPKRHRGAIAFFVAFAILIVIFVEESVRTSSLACKPHPECVVNARRWTFVRPDSLTQCPCLMLIDGDKAPKTFAEWEQPRNLTDKVAQLATMGKLETIQLMNRYLPTLPEELRGCVQMKHLALVYTHTMSFPSWIKELSKLEYLHVEGKFPSSLVDMPHDMFDDMASLTFIHLGVHPAIRQLPSFAGLTNLKSLNIAIFPSLEELPSLDTLMNLERFVLAGLPLLDSLPDFSGLKHLKAFVVVDRGTFCCNGFYGDCNLEHSMCQLHRVWGTPPATCLDPMRTNKLPTAATLELFVRFPYSVCAGEALVPETLEMPPTPESMAQCNGTMYRQCEVEGHPEAMCYNARLMGISCSANPFPIEMRRRQIQEGMGEPCDPEFEAWLGCE